MGVGNTRIWITLALGALSLGFANPEFRELVGQAENIGEMSEIRVLIFPHIGKYASPHGRDTKIDQITIRAQKAGASCRISAARSALAIAPAVAEPVALQAATGEYPQWVKCEGPALVVREKGLPTRAYTGTLWIQKVVPAGGAKPHLEVVEHVDFEDYVRGVVPSEVPSNWHPQALLAQAVAARTYAYTQAQLAARNQGHPDYDVEDTIMDQAYLGMTGRTPQTDQAVQTTRGEVIVYGNEVIKAYFFSDSGGHTEDAINVFGSLPYCRGKAEVYDPKLHHSSWKVSFALPALTKQLIGRGILKAGDSLTGLTVDPALLASGRAHYVWLDLAGGARKRVLADQFRFAAGLRSTWFEIAQPDANTVRLDGRGFGHGVGMSQWGAQLLAQSLKWDYKKIVEFYFSGVRIENLNQ